MLTRRRFANAVQPFIDTGHLEADVRRSVQVVSKTSVFETDRLKTDHPAPATLRRGAVVSKEVSEPIVSILIG